MSHLLPPHSVTRLPAPLRWLPERSAGLLDQRFEGGAVGVE